MCLVSLRQFRDDFVRHAFFSGFLPAFLLIKIAHIPRANVLTHQELVAGKVLENHSDSLAKRIFIPCLQIQAIQQDATLVRPVETGQQLDQRGFSGAVFAHQGQ